MAEIETEREQVRRRQRRLAVTLLAIFCMACGVDARDRSPELNATAYAKAPEKQGDADAAAEAPFEWPIPGAQLVTLKVREFGRIQIELYPDLAPETVKNFVELASTGFYDGTTFHRIIPGFMVQGGDPGSKDSDPTNDGQGGPGYTIPDEISRAPHERGVVAMANAGSRNSAGSQFFIVHKDSPFLDGKYTIFGRVVAGMDRVDQIVRVERDVHGRWGTKDRPLQNIEVVSVAVEDRSAALAETTARRP